jgi:chromosome segregation ATPase
MTRVRPVDGALDYAIDLGKELDEARSALAMAHLEPGAAGEARVRETLAAIRQELAVAETAVETLRDELMQRTRERDAWMATSGAQRLRMEHSAADHLADRRQVQSERDEARVECDRLRDRVAELLSELDDRDHVLDDGEDAARARRERDDAVAAQKKTAAYAEAVCAELEQVRDVLAPLWPVADDGSTAALAGLAALAIVGHRIAEDARQAYAAGLEPVAGRDFTAVWTDETLPDAPAPSRAYRLGHLVGVGIGAIVVATPVGAVVAAVLRGGWPW